MNLNIYMLGQKCKIILDILLALHVVIMILSTYMKTRFACWHCVTCHTFNAQFLTEEKITTLYYGFQPNISTTKLLTWQTLSIRVVTDSSSFVFKLQSKTCFLLINFPHFHFLLWNRVCYHSIIRRYSKRSYVHVSKRKLFASYTKTKFIQSIFSSVLFLV